MNKLNRKRNGEGKVLNENESRKTILRAFGMKQAEMWRE